MIDARSITQNLRGRWCGSYGLMRCPVHDDRNPSLKIKDDHERRMVLMSIVSPVAHGGTSKPNGGAMVCSKALHGGRARPGRTAK